MINYYNFFLSEYSVFFSMRTNLYSIRLKKTNEKSFYGINYNVNTFKGDSKREM